MPLRASALPEREPRDDRDDLEEPYRQGPDISGRREPLTGGHLDALRRTVDDTLSRAGWPAPQWLRTTADDPGSGQAAAAIESGAKVIFVCGGDGTMMSAMSALVGTDTSMAILPAGTGNLLAAILGLSTDVSAGLVVAPQGGLRKLDVGTVEAQHFAVMAGMGFDAHMLDATSDTAKPTSAGRPTYSARCGTSRTGRCG